MSESQPENSSQELPAQNAAPASSCSSEFQSLMARIQAGDEQAAEQFVRDYGEHLERVIRRHLEKSKWLRRQVDSFDVMQSVFRRFFMLARGGHFETFVEEHVERCLMRMAGEKVVNLYYRERAARRDVRRLENTRVDDLGLAAADRSPHDIVADAEMRQKLRGCLTDEERALLEQREAGKTWSDIARGSGVNENTLRMRLRRAWRRAARLLGLE